MDDISESLSQKIDELIEQTTQKVVLPPQTLTVLEDAAQAVAAVVQATEKTYGKDVTASVMKQVAAKARAKKLSAMKGAFDDNTLQQLVGMAIESTISDDRVLTSAFRKLVHGDLDIPAAVEKAARDYERAAQKILEGTFEIARAEDAMDANAPYLMWMTQEGHGVGIHDGDLDGILDVEVLDKLLDTDSTLKAAHAALADAINDSSFEIISEAFEEIVGDANDVYNTALEAAQEAEKERDGSDYFPDGPGDSFAYEHNDVERFVEKNLDDTYLGDLAEVAEKALAEGISGEEIEKAMFDVGEYQFVQGIRAMKNCIVSTGNIGEFDIQIDANNLKVKNAYGEPLTLQQVGQMMATQTGSDVSVSHDFDAKEAASGTIQTMGSADGYFGLFVNPKNLAAKLGLK